MTRYLDTIPQPWPREAIETAIFENFTDARSAIEDTYGGKLWSALSRLEDTRLIFEFNVKDLLDEIAIFADRSTAPGFWHRGITDEAAAHTLAVKRKLFNCTSALMTLVDHARHFHQSNPVDGYVERRSADFPTPGLHKFLQDLRNYNTHWRIAEANWQISTDFTTKTRKFQFLITKDELLQWEKWTLQAKNFIAQTEVALDVYELFVNYRKQVHSFYAWHKAAVLDQYAETLRPYFEYKRLYEGFQKKSNWNLLLSIGPKTLNPYEFLSRYLSQMQLERLLAYEHRSEEQVDAVIRMLGMEDFCDDALRRKALAVLRGTKEDKSPTLKI